jgi:hypothetical protein
MIAVMAGDDGTARSSLNVVIRSPETAGRGSLRWGDAGLAGPV